MAVTTGSANLYDKFKLELGKGSFNLTSDTLKVMLLTSVYTPVAATDDFVSGISANEVASAGYARTAVTPSWALDGSTARLILTDPVFTASGADMVARYWVLFKDDGVADASSRLIAYGLLNEADLDVTATDGNSITVDFANTLGLFSI